MEIQTIQLTMAEKLAIVHVVDSVILADGHVHKGEIGAITRLMKILDFDSNLIMQAGNITLEQALSILKGMPEKKKDMLKSTLEMIAISDGFVHEKETAIIADVFQSIGSFQELE